MEPPPGVRAYTALVQAYAAAGRFPECAQLMGEMRGRGVRPNVVTYSTLANGFVTCGMLEEARELLQEMQARGCAALRWLAGPPASQPGG